MEEGKRKRPVVPLRRNDFAISQGKAQSRARSKKGGNQKRYKKKGRKTEQKASVAACKQGLARSTVAKKAKEQREKKTEPAALCVPS